MRRKVCVWVAIVDKSCRLLEEAWKLEGTRELEVGERRLGDRRRLDVGRWHRLREVREGLWLVDR